jgi:hypothetical protein
MPDLVLDYHRLKTPIDHPDLSVITQKIASGAVHKVYQKVITFTASVTTTVTSPWSAPLHSFTFTSEGGDLLILFLIPHTGNDTAGTRSKTAIFLDGQLLSQSITQKYNTDGWELVNWICWAYVTGVSAGSHTVDLRAYVSGGTLNIPHYNTSLMEAASGYEIKGQILVIEIKR